MARAKNSKPPLPVWEAHTGVAESAIPGLIGPQWATRLSWALGLFFTVLLWPGYGLVGLLMAFIFARMVALDLTTYTLPNIYTVPLMAVGFVVALGSHMGGMLMVWAALLVAAGVGRRLPHTGLGLGEGDLKLMAAMVGCLGPLGALAAMALGCFLWLPGAWVAPKQALPLGVPLLLGWVVVLAFPALPVALFSPITV